MVTEKMSRKDWMSNTYRSTVHAIPALFMPIIVLGGMYGGFMTCLLYTSPSRPAYVTAGSAAVLMSIILASAMF